MPDSEVSRTTACVPSCSGAYGSCTAILTAAWSSCVSEIDFTVPTARPPTCTLSPFTSWPALTKISVYSWPPGPRSSSSHTARIATRTIPPTAAARATVTRRLLLHSQGPAGGPGQELADELVVGVEQLLGRP